MILKINKIPQQKPAKFFSLLPNVKELYILDSRTALYTIPHMVLPCSEYLVDENRYLYNDITIIYQRQLHKYFTTNVKNCTYKLNFSNNLIALFQKIYIIYLYDIYVSQLFILLIHTYIKILSTIFLK